MKQDDLVTMLLANLREAFDGPDDPEFAWFNSDRDMGFIGVLRTIDPATASQSVTPGAKTIAAHVAHAAFHLRASAAWLRGDKAAAGWGTTWDPPQVSAADWIALQQLMRQQYRDVGDAIKAVKDWSPDELGGAIGAIAHATYHLGAVRQIIRALGHTGSPPAAPRRPAR